MFFEQVALDAAWHVTIDWSRPAPYEAVIARGSRHDFTGWLYMILGSRVTDPTRIWNHQQMG